MSAEEDKQFGDVRLVKVKDGFIVAGVEFATAKS